MLSLKNQAASSVLWSAIERFSVQGIQFVLTMLIARVLLPSDFGLIAMLAIFMAIAQTFIDSGFANALIQKKDRSEEDYSTVFYFNGAISVVLYLLLYIASPYIASFYNETQLDLITKVVGLSLIINALGIVQRARLTIALDFKRQAYASLSAVIVSGILGVWMAYKGYGVWALVIQSLLNNLLNVLLLWIFAKWCPRLCFSYSSFKTLFSFGSKLLLSSLLHTLYTNLYGLVIGKKFLAIELGYYNRAFTFAQFPSVNLANILMRAIYPIQCRIQDDTKQMRSFFLKYLRLSCYCIFPVMIGLCVLSEPLVRLILTDKWLSVVPLMQILCIAYMWDPVMKINTSVLQAKGYSDYFLYAEIIKKIVALIILFISIPYGVKIMCAGLILYAFADMIIISFYSKKLISVSFFEQMKTLLPIILLSFSMGALTYLLSLLFENAIIKLLLGSIAGVLYYLLISYLFKFEEFNILLSLLKLRK